MVLDFGQFGDDAVLLGSGLRGLLGLAFDGAVLFFQPSANFIQLNDK